MQLFSKLKLKHVLLTVGFIFVLDFFGAFTHMFEKSYFDNFSYPYEGNIQPLVAALKHNVKSDVPPINFYNYSFLHNPKDKCSNKDYETLKIVFFVKSALENFERRATIRRSWGFESRFFDVPTKTIFVLGTHPNDDQAQSMVDAEAAKYNDIVQANFVDAYFNNTAKTMMTFKWIARHCANSKFYMFVDDDMYVSVKNVLRFLRNPTNYPDYLKNIESLVKSKRETKEGDFINATALEKAGENRTEIRSKRQVFDFELPDDVRLFAGFVFMSSPHRHKSSKWYVSLEEYPYHLWPPYVTAGSYVLSKEALLDMYYTSFYTKHFRFDDIFLGLVAKKAEIEPFHCEEFHFYKKEYTKFNYKYVVTSHGYDNSQELLYVWNEQKALGNA